MFPNYCSRLLQIFNFLFQFFQSVEKQWGFVLGIKKNALCIMKWIFYFYYYFLNTDQGTTAFVEVSSLVVVHCLIPASMWYQSSYLIPASTWMNLVDWLCVLTMRVAGLFFCSVSCFDFFSFSFFLKIYVSVHIGFFPLLAAFLHTWIVNVYDIHILKNEQYIYIIAHPISFKYKI